MQGEGPEAGQHVADKVGNLATVHRGKLLHALLESLRPSRLHLCKCLLRISGRSSNQRRNSLHFADGTTAEADLVIGADGIRSRVRHHILGDNDPAVEPVFAGFWDVRNLVPISTAMELLGHEKINLSEPRQHGYYGNGTS